MAYTFGTRSYDVVTDPRGNVLNGINLTFEDYFTGEALGGATTVNGAWLFVDDSGTHASIKVVLPDGSWFRTDAAEVQGVQGPAGPRGADGAPGVSPNIVMGTVTTVPYGSGAAASIDGVSPDLTLNLTLPSGPTDYSLLTNRPTLATVATSGSYTDLANKPTLSTVAGTGSYTDLANKPVIPVTAADVGAVATTAKGVANGVASLDATGKVPAAQLPAAGGTGTVTKVNNVAPDGTGNVTLVPGSIGATPVVANVTSAPVDNYIGNWTVNYATSGVSPQVLSVFYNGAGQNIKTFWLNENGAPRAAMGKSSDSAIKLLGYPGGGTGNTVEIQSVTSGGGRNTVIGVNDAGFNLGNSAVPAVLCVVIAAGASGPPAGTPAGTVVIKKRA